MQQNIRSRRGIDYIHICLRAYSFVPVFVEMILLFWFVLEFELNTRVTPSASPPYARILLNWEWLWRAIGGWWWQEGLIFYDGDRTAATDSH